MWKKNSVILFPVTAQTVYTIIKDTYLEVDRRRRIFGLYPHHAGLYFWRWSEVVFSYLHKHNISVSLHMTMSNYAFHTNLRIYPFSSSSQLYELIHELKDSPNLHEMIHAG